MAAITAQVYKTTYYWNNALGGLINAALAAPLLLSAAKIGCGQAVVPPNAPALALADFNECTFTGYARSATVVWGTPISETDGTLTSFSPSHQFLSTDAVTPNTVNNIFITDGVAAGGAGILGYAKVVPGLLLNAAGKGFTVQVGWNEGAVTVNSQSVTAN